MSVDKYSRCVIKNIVQCLMLVVMAFFLSSIDAAPFDRFLMPGKLIKSHQKFEKKCDDCHEAFDKEKQSDNCLKCHKKINVDVVEKKGFHGKSQNVSGVECKFCHTDHIGRQANVVHLDKASFNHDDTDFVLKEAHKKVLCESCHLSDKKYRDAKRLCFDCHESDDVHKQRLGKKCKDCHSVKSWVKTEFDHDKTKFKLKGKHKKVSCGDCHPNQRYKSTPKACVDCHKIQDVHQGELGAKCKKCHKSTKWNKILFNHDKQTKFKLKYRHEKISCGSCHTKNAYKFKLKKTCFSCHKADDKHNTQFGDTCDECHLVKSWKKIVFNHNNDTDYELSEAHKDVRCTNCHNDNIYEEELESECIACHDVDDIHNGKLGKKCTQCHSVDDWQKDILFDHDLSKFPLIGLHGRISCESCHQSTEYKMEKTHCYICHKSDDEHELKLTSKCEQCHNPNGWRVWFFSHNDETDYELDGEHVFVECVACHKQAIKGKKEIILSGKCESCHMDDDIHSGQFGKRCGRCHETDSFKNILNMN